MRLLYLNFLLGLFIGCMVGTVFLRAKELSDLGITSHSGFPKFVEQVNADKVRDRIKFGWGQKK